MEPKIQIRPFKKLKSISSKEFFVKFKSCLRFFDRFSVPKVNAEDENLSYSSSFGGIISIFSYAAVIGVIINILYS